MASAMFFLLCFMLIYKVLSQQDEDAIVAIQLDDSLSSEYGYILLFISLIQITIRKINITFSISLNLFTKFIPICSFFKQAEG